MSHKLDKMRHRRNVRNRMRQIKSRYMKLTQNDSIAPDKALSTLKDSAQVDEARRLARLLSARGIYVRFGAEK